MAVYGRRAETVVGIALGLVGCHADVDHHNPDGGIDGDASMPRCLTNPTIEFCDDFESAGQQISPFGFGTYPDDPLIETTIVVGGNSQSALQIHHLPGTSVPAYGITPTLPIPGTSATAVLRFDANIKYYGTRIMGIAFDNGTAGELILSDLITMNMFTLNGDAARTANPGYMYFLKWMTIEVDMAFDPTNITVSVKMAPQGMPLVTVLGPFPAANDPPPTNVRVFLGDQGGGLEYLTLLDNITLDY